MTGQDRADIGVGLGMAERAEILRKAFTLDELEAIEARVRAAQEQLKQLPAPAPLVL